MRAPHEQEAFVRLQRAASSQLEELVRLLKPRGISAPQYNVLRILRGAKEEALTCSDIAARMISRDPDITRLLDRMEARGWVSRCRGEEDLRNVKARITAEGLALLKELDAPVAALHKRQFVKLDGAKADKLLKLLDLLSESERPPSASNSR